MAPNQQNNPNYRISAAKDKADSYHGIVANDVNAQVGMNGAAPMSYKVTRGSTVRVIGKYDGYYVAVLPNNRVGLLPINGTNLTTPMSTQPIPAPPGTGNSILHGTGTTGTPVVPGTTGTIPGRTGSPGMTGTPGTTGSPGTAGTPPRVTSPGAAGTTGTTGAPGTAGNAAAPATPGSTTSGGFMTDASAMVNLVNQARAQAGLNPLSIDGSVANLARLKATDLAANNYFSHTSPTYGSPFDMMKKYGVSYLYAGENLAINTNVQAAETALMNSPEHKANILNHNYTNIGIGIAQKADGTRVYVQMFIGR